VTLNELVADALEMVRPACAHNKVELPFPRADARLVVSGEAQGLRESLINLLLNAVEAATRHPGKQPRVAVELEGRDGDRAIVRVKDSGPGPSPETAETLFEPFVSEKPEGTGLGLFVARQIAEAHGGSLGWTRADGMTCFEIELPLIDDDTDHGTSTGS
jgi:signal transduction histidine kinase